MVPRVAIVDAGERPLNIAETLRNTGSPIVAVAGAEGNLKGTTRERTLARRIGSLEENFQTL